MTFEEALERLILKYENDLETLEWLGAIIDHEELRVFGKVDPLNIMKD